MERNKSRENAAAIITDSYMLEEEDMAPPLGATSQGDNKESQITEPAATTAMPASKKDKKDKKKNPQAAQRRLLNADARNAQTSRGRLNATPLPRLLRRTKWRKWRQLKPAHRVSLLQATLRKT